MADIKIIDLPLASAVATSVVPVMNANGTATNSVTLQSIAALGGGAPSSHAATHAASGPDAITPASIAAAEAVHGHGAITADGRIGTTSGVPVITGSSGSLTTGAFGSASGTFCAGDDPRLTNARTAIAHASSHATGGADAITCAAIGAATAGHSHGNVTSDGAIGTTSNLPIMTGASGVLRAGSFGNAAATVCEGNDSRLSDARTPTAHAASHAANGTDALTLNISQVSTLSATLALKVNSDTTGVTGAVAITNMMKVTQAQYDAIATKDPNTLYVIV